MCPFLMFIDKNCLYILRKFFSFILEECLSLNIWRQIFNLLRRIPILFILFYVKSLLILKIKFKLFKI